MFQCNGNEGFQMTFANGWTVSVQFGVMSYCSRKNRSGTKPDFDAPLKARWWESKTAEIAAWHTTDGESRKDGDWYVFEDGERVKGYCNADEVSEFIQMISALNKYESEVGI